MTRKLHIKTSHRLKPALCILKATQFHLIESIFAWWTAIENENDNDVDDDIDVDKDDDRKNQDSAPSQRQNQQPASINLAVNSSSSSFNQFSECFWETIFNQ